MLVFQVVGNRRMSVFGEVAELVEAICFLTEQSDEEVARAVSASSRGLGILHRTTGRLLVIDPVDGQNPALPIIRNIP